MSKSENELALLEVVKAARGFLLSVESLRPYRSDKSLAQKRLEEALANRDRLNP